MSKIPDHDPSGCEILLRFVLHTLTPMFLDGHDNDPMAARSAAMQALMTYEVFSVGDLVLSFQIISLRLAATKASLASLDSSLTPYQQRRHRLHAAEFNGRARQIATFLDANNPAFKARLEAYKRSVTAMPYPQPHPATPPSAPSQPKPDGKPHPVVRPSPVPQRLPPHPQPAHNLPRAA